MKISLPPLKLLPLAVAFACSSTAPPARADVVGTFTAGGISTAGFVGIAGQNSIGRSADGAQQRGLLFTLEPVATVNLSPGVPNTNSILTATASATPGGTYTFTYVWTKLTGTSTTTLKTTSNSTATSDTLDLSVTGNGDQGDLITVTVTATNTGSGIASAPASASVAVLGSAPLNQVPGAQTTAEDTPLMFSSASTPPNPIGVSDVDNTPLTTTLSVINGVLTLSRTTGLTFEAGALGIPTTNGSANIKVSGSQADLNAALNGLRYDPTPNFNGSAELSILTSDGMLTDTDTVAITVTAVNDAPVAVDDSYMVSGAALTIAAPGVLGNDTDVEGNKLTAALATPPANGTVVLNADGSFTYTPNVDSSGPDSFTYTVSDGLATATGTVNLTVENAPQSPRLTMTVEPARFSENAGPNATLVTLTRNVDLDKRISARLVSSNAREARVPETVAIPSGAKSVQFWIEAVDDGVLDGNKVVTIAALATGFPRITTTVQVLDNGPVRVPMQLTVQPAGFAENAGARAAIGEVSIPVPAKIDYAIELVSSNSAKVRVPKTVTIRAGRARSAFLIGAVDDNLAGGTQAVTITARRQSFGTASAVVKVGDDETRSLLLTVDNSTVREGGFVLATVTRNWAIQSEMTVLVQNTNAAAVTVTNAVAISAGLASATFPLYGIDNNTPGDTRSATITVNRPGLTPDSVTVNVVDRNAPASFGTASRVTLSTTLVSAMTQTMVLRFGGPLNLDSVPNARFSVLVNGAAVPVERLAFDTATNSFTLLLPDDSLKTGDRVEVTWSNLFDSKNAVVQGHTTNTAS